KGERKSYDGKNKAMSNTTPKGRFARHEGESGQHWLDRLMQLDEGSLSKQEMNMLRRAKSCAGRQMRAEPQLPLMQGILDRADFIGDDVFSLHENDTPEPRLLVAEVISRLPEGVRGWLLNDTRHVFICGYGQVAEYIDRYIPPESFPERTQDGF